jgi:hypothetical protein
MSKINSSHSTYIERAKDILKYLNKHSNVTNISLGIIKIKHPPSNTHGKFKITMTQRHILLEINSKSSNQEIHIFGKDLQTIAHDVAKELRNEGLEISFGKHFKKETKMIR